MAKLSWQKTVLLAFFLPVGLLRTAEEAVNIRLTFHHLWKAIYTSCRYWGKLVFISRASDHLMNVSPIFTLILALCSSPLTPEKYIWLLAAKSCSMFTSWLPASSAWWWAGSVQSTFQGLDPIKTLKPKQWAERHQKCFVKLREAAVQWLLFALYIDIWSIAILEKHWWVQL